MGMLILFLHFSIIYPSFNRGQFGIFMFYIHIYFLPNTFFVHMIILFTPSFKTL